MDDLPDLDRLSVAEKDALIRELWPLRVLVQQLLEQVATLTAKVTELEGRLALNSRNSSKPPSTNGYGKPHHSRSKDAADKKPKGGQPGHQGHTLKKTDTPDHVVSCEPPTHCPDCDMPLPLGKVEEVRQVFDVPVKPFEVTEYRVVKTQCTCGKVHCGAFPEGVTGLVQYGSNVKAIVTHMICHQMMPLKRTGQLMGDLFGLPISDASILNMLAEAQSRLTQTVDCIKEMVGKALVVHADETGMHVAGKLHWAHVASTSLLTWIGSHAKRGMEAINHFGVLTSFTGTLVHDGWRTYRDLLCGHALCNAHHLRELTYVFEEMGQQWAKKLITLLTEANKETVILGSHLPTERITHYRACYVEILSEGDTANSRAPPSGKKGKTKQSKSRNLLDRLILYADDVWRFTVDHNVPFSNNLAERDVRMPKVKMKISGGFRTVTGLETFCVIRSYLATLQKQGENTLQALVQTFQGAPLQPRFT